MKRTFQVFAASIVSVSLVVSSSVFANSDDWADDDWSDSSQTQSKPENNLSDLSNLSRNQQAFARAKSTQTNRTQANKSDDGSWGDEPNLKTISKHKSSSLPKAPSHSTRSNKKWTLAQANTQSRQVNKWSDDKWGDEPDLNKSSRQNVSATSSYDLKSSSPSKFSAAYYKPRFSLGPFYDTDVDYFGLFDLFAPYAFNEDTILFADARYKWNHGPTGEGNYGLGMRHIFAHSQTYLGLYTFYDRRTSVYSNIFNQITVGGEFKSEHWSLAANAYIPVGTTEYSVSSLNYAQLVPANNGFQNIGYRPGAEKAMTGGDILGGWLIPKTHGLGIWLGGFYYSATSVKTAAGPIVHTEYAIERDSGRRLLGIFNKIHLVADYQHDDLRGSTWFAGARFDILFGHQQQLHGIQRRMQDFVRRDLNIETGPNSKGALTLLTNADGSLVTVQQESGTFTASTANIIGIVGATTGAGVTLASGQEVNGGAFNFNVDGEQYSVNVGSNGSITDTVGQLMTTANASTGATIQNITLNATAGNAVGLGTGVQGTLTVSGASITSTNNRALNFAVPAAGGATTTINIANSTMNGQNEAVFISSGDATSPITVSLVGNTIAGTAAEGLDIQTGAATANITLTQITSNTISTAADIPAVLLNATTNGGRIAVNSMTGNAFTSTGAGANSRALQASANGAGVSAVNLNSVSGNTFTASTGTVAVVDLLAGTTNANTVTVADFNSNTFTANAAGATAYGLELRAASVSATVIVTGFIGNTFNGSTAAAGAIQLNSQGTGVAEINVNSGLTTLRNANNLVNNNTVSLAGAGANVLVPGA